MVNRNLSIPHDNEPFLPATLETVSFSLPSVEAWEQAIQGSRPAWVYLTDGNPTVRYLEERLAELHGAENCWAVTSGKFAIAATLLALLSQGDHFILLTEGYKSTRHFSEQVLSRMGISHSLVSVDELHELDKYVIPNQTKLILLESPTNPMTRCLDIRAVSKRAKALNLLVLLDNSLAGFHQHHNLGVDLYLHSLSKYASGVGDVMGGAVIGRSELVKKVKLAHTWNSDALAAQTAQSLIRGLETYALRIERQSQTAFQLARLLENLPQVSRVLYPGLETHPDHEIAKAQMKDFGSVLAFDVAGDEQVMRNVLNALKVFKIAFGTGYTRSIANPAWLFYARSFAGDRPSEYAVQKSTIRLSVGLEPFAELAGDLQNALESGSQENAAKSERPVLERQVGNAHS